jgi:flagellar biosynthesis anti-sigma factor FlgM
MTTMRIGAPYSQSSTGTEAATKGSAAHHHGHRAAGASSEAPATTSAVKVTWSAKALALDAQSPESSDKVQALRSQVESGQLNVDPDKIAAAIIGE